MCYGTDLDEQEEAAEVVPLREGNEAHALHHIVVAPQPTDRRAQVRPTLQSHKTIRFSQMTSQHVLIGLDDGSAGQITL
jgi:hypothetical protein